METLTYRIDQFEGPLDLLLTLIIKNKVSIEDIPIAMICDQYLDYLDHCREMDMEVASEFLVLASELVLIKTRMLLPNPEEDDEDPRAALAAALLEYQRIKTAVPLFSEYYGVYSGRFVKDTDEIPPDNSVIQNQSVDKLFEAMKRVLSNVKPAENEGRTFINPIIKKQIVPVSLKIDHVRNLFLKKAKFKFIELFYGAESKSEVIATFIAILELIKIGSIGIDEESECTDGEKVVLVAKNIEEIADGYSYGDEYDRKE